MNKTQFIIRYSEELQEAAENLKLIRKALNSLENNSIEEELDRVVKRYDRYINDLIWGNPNMVDMDEMVNAAIENEWRNGTEPQFMMQAIEDVFNLLTRKGLVSQEKDADSNPIIEMSLPYNVSSWLKDAATQSQEQSAKKVSRWVEKLGRRIVGGTSIGKSPQTLILDITHHGSQIYIDASGEIEYNDIEVSDFKSFKEVFDEEFNKNEKKTSIANPVVAIGVNESGEDRSEFDKLYAELVPIKGSASTLNGEILRAASRLEYEYYNNGNGNAAQHEYEETSYTWTNDDDEEETDYEDEWMDCSVSPFYMSFINLLRKEVPEVAEELEQIEDIICRNPDTTVPKAQDAADAAVYTSMVNKVVAHIKANPDKNNIPYEALDED